MSEYKTDLEIAREANKKPIIDLAKKKFSISDQDLIPYGHYKAKISSNFLDKVENRNSKTFVQCIGRVLSKDKENKKKYGLILDLKATSCLKICDRMNQYLNCTIREDYVQLFQYHTHLEL